MFDAALYYVMKMMTLLLDRYPGLFATTLLRLIAAMAAGYLSIRKLGQLSAFEVGANCKKKRFVSSG
jgi:hypothetical protein